MKPYSFNLATEYPDVYTAIRLPLAVVMVTVNGEFCCHAGISSNGVLDVFLPEDTYLRIQSGQSKMLFPVFVHSSGDRGQLEAIEIVDLE